MILFQRGRKMTELCATRMELDCAFVEFPQLLRAGFPRVSTASSRCQSDCTFQMIARARRGPLCVRCKNSKRQLAAKPSASIAPSTYLSRWLLPSASIAMIDGSSNGVNRSLPGSMSQSGQTHHFDHAPITSGTLLADNFRAGQHCLKGAESEVFSLAWGTACRGYNER